MRRANHRDGRCIGDALPLLLVGGTQIERRLHAGDARHDFRLGMLRRARALALRLDDERGRGGHHVVERFLRRRLLGRATARAGAGHLHVELRHRAFDFELLIVRGAVRRDDGISRQRDLVALQIFLEQRLRVLADGARIDVIEDRRVETLDDRMRGVETAVEEDRAENRFERIRQDRRTAETAAAQFAFTEPERFRHVQRLRDFIKRLLFDEVGANARKIAFVEFCESLEQKRSHHAI